MSTDLEPELTFPPPSVIPSSVSQQNSDHSSTSKDTPFSLSQAVSQVLNAAPFVKGLIYGGVHMMEQMGAICPSLNCSSFLGSSAILADINTLGE